MSSAIYSPLPTGDDAYPPSRAAGLPPWRAHGSRARTFLSDRVATWGFYGAAILTGLSLHLLGSYVFGTQPAPISPSSLYDSIIKSTPPRPGASIDSGSYLRTGLGQLVSPAEARDINYLREMVSETKGYYTRDYSVWLGWNNVRSVAVGMAQRS